MPRKGYFYRLCFFSWAQVACETQTLASGHRLLCPGPYLHTFEAHYSLKVQGTGLDLLPIPQGPPSLSPFIFSLPGWPSRHSSESARSSGSEKQMQRRKGPRDDFCLILRLKREQIQDFLGMRRQRKNAAV